MANHKLHFLPINPAPCHYLRYK